MNACMHTYIYKYRPTYLHTHVPSRIQCHTNTNTNTDTNTNTNTNTPQYMLLCNHMFLCFITYGALLVKCPGSGGFARSSVCIWCTVIYHNLLKHTIRCDKILFIIPWHTRVQSRDSFRLFAAACASCIAEGLVFRIQCAFPKPMQARQIIKAIPPGSCYDYSAMYPKPYSNYSAIQALILNLQ